MMTRTTRICLTLAAITIAAGAGAFAYLRTDQPAVAPAVASGLRFADSLERSYASQPVEASDALVSLYLERARLGIGSPFRLIEQALRDPMLPPDVRRQTAYAVLGRTAEGMIYSSPAEALDLLSARGRGLGLAHRNFIEGVIDSAREPRAAELALRLAYQVTSTSGTTSPRAGAVAIATIAQARDRALAMRDVNALLIHARRRRLDPVDLVPVWRAERRFSVERPLVDPATPSQEREAAALLPMLIAGLDTIRDPAPRTRRERTLGTQTSAAAMQVAVARRSPPQAPIVVTMGGFGNYVTAGGLTPGSRAARSTFVARARSEEELVAAYEQLRVTEAYAAEAALSVVTAAVAMRPYAQEQPWFAGDAGPTVDELRRDFGVAAVDFDASVPGAWQPYFTRMLASVVTDLRRVFPDLDVSGLTVRFGPSPLKERALALHDPLTRTVYFPIETSAGAMAHEFSHDLDWQAARRRYGSQNSYRTDRSMRQYRDGLAATLDRMAGSAASGRRGVRVSPGGDRPTEAFARGVDWIVASWLASEGVMNGYLSAVQDEWLTGYASASAPQRDLSDGDATMIALREITTVAPGMVTWFAEAYGDARRASLSDAVRRTLLAPLPRVDLRSGTMGMSGWAAALQTLRASPDASGNWSCQLRTPALSRSDVAMLRTAMETAADARVRGLTQRWGDHAARTRSSWRLRSLGGAPWRPEIADSLTRELRDALLWRAARPDDGRAGADFAERAERAAAREACAGAGSGG
ncbi:MAG: hypothetical protein IT361_03290 [Gemmatimonadaceae bacterium]|nr:hypothetical protein [Gemmatimonadaceae bacterium]